MPVICVRQGRGDSMAHITFLPMNQITEAEEGESILSAASRLGIDITGVCAGKGTCGKCKVLVTKGNNNIVEKEEAMHLTETELKAGIRLGCRFFTKEDACVILSKTRKRKMPLEYRKRIEGEIGVVFDIGTTSVEAAAYDLTAKKEFARLSKANPQKVGGGDVISRMVYSLKGEKYLYQMKNLIIGCCNDLLEEIIEGFLPEDRENIKENITKVIVAGNTTMSHFFLGRTVEGISKAPFRPAFEGAIHLSNEKMDFTMSCKGDIFLLPNICGHVGSDTLACVIATDLCGQQGVQLILDIGTNGEMVLLNHGQMTCCSVAAGPAFEGASIYQGMQAIEGAIKGVGLQEGNIVLDVIGDELPRGICGSGMIDALSVMLDLEEMDKTGRIIADTEWKLYSGEANVVVTQKDVREIQLAKSAIFSGIMTLLEEKSLSINEIDKFYIAGTFGSNLKIENAVKIGLIPAVNSDKIVLIGNGAIKGGARILTENISQGTLEKVAQGIKHIELAHKESFRKSYVESMNF